MSEQTRDIAVPDGGRHRAARLFLAVIALFERIPYWLVALVARLALAQVFWSSAQTHLANWDTTLALFSDQYQVPLLPPDLAAALAVTMEVLTPPLLLLGLATRFAALGLFGMTLVIEVFVYPEAWPTHIQWAAMILLLMARGAGGLSLDRLIRGLIRARFGRGW